MGVRRRAIHRHSRGSRGDKLGPEAPRPFEPPQPAARIRRYRSYDHCRRRTCHQISIDYGRRVSWKTSTSSHFCHAQNASLDLYLSHDIPKDLLSSTKRAPVATEDARAHLTLQEHRVHLGTTPGDGEAVDRGMLPFRRQLGLVGRRVGALNTATLEGIEARGAGQGRWQLPCLSAFESVRHPYLTSES